MNAITITKPMQIGEGGSTARWGVSEPPQSVVANLAEVDQRDLALAGSLALGSRCPLAKVIAAASGAVKPLAGHEFPELGVTTWVGDDWLKLGSPFYCNRS